ncbi:hypothetical protein LPJ77_004489 [Coemansia sp. RSA 2523]|nr:hypothetical protein LPJ77_004489 [Coemansia sp. RSA 2523]
MYTVFIFNGHEKYLVAVFCGPATRVSNIKSYASLWMKVPAGDISLYAFDISDRALSDNVRFDEAKMPQSEDAKYIMVYAAVPFKIDDHPIRHTRRVK